MRRICFCRNIPMCRGATGAKAGNLITLLLMLVLARLCVAAPAVGTITGTVTNDEGLAVPHATVRVVGTSFSTESDDLGKFNLINLPLGVVSVLVTALGHESIVIGKVLLNEDAPTTIRVRLNIRVIPIEGIRVLDSNEILSSSPDVIITRDDIQRSHSRTIGEAIEQAPGIQVEKNSGTVSIRGCSPEHVVILLDGQRVAPASSGVSSLNGIAIESVERIEVRKGGTSAMDGPDAVGGVIAITSRNPKFTPSHPAASASSRIGSYQLSRWEGSVTVPKLIRRLSITADVAREGFDGNFPFHYSAPGRSTVFEGDRVNNRSSSEIWHSTVLWDASKTTNIRLNGHLYEGRNGLPSRASRQDSSGYRTDNRESLSAQLTKAASKNSSLTFRSGWMAQEQYFDDSGDKLAANRYKSQFDDESISASFECQRTLWSNAEIRVGGEARYSSIEHEDMIRPTASSGKSHRGQQSVWTGLSHRFVLSGLYPMDAIFFSTAWRYDHVSTRHDATAIGDTIGDQSSNSLSPLYSVALTTTGKNAITIRGSYGKSLRVPPVNSLFWKGDVRSRGNPFLRPENAEHSEVGIRGNLEWKKHRLDVGAIYSHSHAAHTIVWQPGQGEVWRPENIGSSLTTGHEEDATLELFSGMFALQYSNAVMLALNKTQGANSYDKFLTYTPQFITSINGRVKWKWLWADWRTRLVGMRWANTSNTSAYPGYRVDDIGTGATLKLGNDIKLLAELRIDNLFDEDYVVVTHYPMPGRQTSLSFGVTYGDK